MEQIKTSNDEEDDATPFFNQRSPAGLNQDVVKKRPTFLSTLEERKTETLILNQELTP